MIHSRNQNILSFFVLIVLFSVPFWVLDIIFPVEILPGLPLSALGVLMPTLAAGILVDRNAHLSGVIQLLRRAFDLNRVQKSNSLE